MEAKDTAKAERLSILESMMDIKAKYLSNRTQQGQERAKICDEIIIASGYHSSRPTLATTDVLLFLKACVEPFGGKFEVANGGMISEIDIKVPLTT